jgi:hypothetical protein
MLAGLAFAPHVAQRGIVTATLLLGLVIINTTPANPYFVVHLANMGAGQIPELQRRPSSCRCCGRSGGVVPVAALHR